MPADSLLRRRCRSQMRDDNPHSPKNPPADSAGVPWEGRQFESNPWQGDDGKPDSRVAEVLKQLNVRRATVDDLLAVLPGTRLLAPLLAHVGEVGVGAHGQKVDKRADLSIVAVATPDGATAIPAFTDVSAMLAWRQEARPVPVEVEKLALAAVGEGHTRVVLNPATDRVALRRPQLKALAMGQMWINPSKNPDLLQSVESVLSAVPEVTAHQVNSADPFGTLESAELEIALTLVPGMPRPELELLMGRLAGEISQLPTFAEVDSLKFRVLVNPQWGTDA